MQTIRNILAEADANHRGVGHFNFSDTAGFRAIAGAARELSLPVFFGTSEGERDFIGLSQAVALVRSLREEGLPVFLNADHTYSFEGVKAAVDAGYDAVIFDGTKLPFEENVRIAKQCVEYARSKNPDIFVEGELGYIGTSSKLLDELPEGASVTEEHITKSEEAAQFVKETGVDALAPAVGNLHGMFKNAPNPRLFIDRIREIKQATGGIPLVLHGGSGVSDDDFRAAVLAGMTVVHVNTELRVAWKKGLEAGLEAHASEIAPYKILPSAEEEMKEVVKRRVALFAGIS